MIQNILLATDSSASAERAADFAASLAMRYGAKVTVLHAFTPVPSYLGEPDYSRRLYKTLDEADSLVADVRERLRDRGAPDVDTDTAQGPAASMILNVADSRKPDLLVVAAWGLGTWQGIFLGSVSMAVTQRAECPALVVK